MTQRDFSSADGALVDGQIAEPVAVVDQFTEDADLPAIVLSESTVEHDTVARVIEAGATDVFPRTTASAQFELAILAVADTTLAQSIKQNARLRAIMNPNPE